MVQALLSFFQILDELEGLRKARGILESATLRCSTLLSTNHFVENQRSFENRTPTS